ncbi:unnamed protein product [Bursaphelenchus xylophilus]|uniref:(pine wood nematode) hypothetical protein n=1 Tax=Bursaphelenchus xylophilus TaxID=6326 RepID=A0A1I7SF10_BURXY|nr:unnamed protein product [Bursaphelenchus xylophilus]CAG9088833.1 unnamed protein product [Bursaphelenchus xylophilus]
MSFHLVSSSSPTGSLLHQSSVLDHHQECRSQFIIHDLRIFWTSLRIKVSLASDVLIPSHRHISIASPLQLFVTYRPFMDLNSNIPITKDLHPQQMQLKFG